MSLDTDVAILRGLPIFSAFTDEQLRLLAFAAEPLELSAGTVLFKQGAPAVNGFLVVAGSVRLYSEGEDGPVEKGVVGPGGLIGELALLCPTTRPATAETIEATSLRSIPRRGLRRVLEEYPELAEAMRRGLAQRLAALTSQLESARRSLLTGD